MRRTAILAGVFLSSLASACYWDSDTLAEEMRGKLNIVDALVGRIRRFPPIYYEKRIEINIPRARNGDLEAFDNVSVAYSHLGKDDEAIKWIQKKRIAMAGMGSKASSDDRYRTESNEGTFYLVKWLSAEESKRQPLWLLKSHKMITAALKINPNAHFGRERVQLRLVEWIQSNIEPKEGRHQSLGEFLTPSNAITPDKATITGLVGLMVLGAAWESPDVISVVGSSKEESSIAMMADLRIKELEESGMKRLFDVYLRTTVMSSPYAEVEENTKRNYELLRNDANAFREDLGKYVTETVKAGKHPDSHGEAFWANYVEPQRPALISVKVKSEFERRWPVYLIIGTVLLLIAATIISVFVFVFRSVKRARYVKRERERWERGE